MTSKNFDVHAIASSRWPIFEVLESFAGTPGADLKFFCDDVENGLTNWPVLRGHAQDWVVWQEKRYSGLRQFITSKTFSKNTRPAGSVHQKLPLILDPGSAHLYWFPRGQSPLRTRRGVQIQDQGSMASFDTLIQLVWCFWKKFWML